MKKIIAISAAVVMALSLVACGGDKPASSTAAPASSVAASSEAASSEAASSEAASSEAAAE